MSDSCHSSQERINSATGNVPIVNPLIDNAFIDRIIPIAYKEVNINASGNNIEYSPQGQQQFQSSFVQNLENSKSLQSMKRKDEKSFDTTSQSSDLKLNHTSFEKSLSTLEENFFEENEKQDQQMENLGILKQEVNQFLNLLQNFKKKQGFGQNLKKNQINAKQLLNYLPNNNINNSNANNNSSNNNNANSPFYPNTNTFNSFNNNNSNSNNINAHNINSNHNNNTNISNNIGNIGANCSRTNNFNNNINSKVINEIKTESNLTQEPLFTIFSESEKDSRQSGKNSEKSSGILQIPDMSSNNLSNLVSKIQIGENSKEISNITNSNNINIANQDVNNNNHIMSNSNNNKSATILSQKQVAHTENSAEKQRNKWPVSKSQQIQTNPEQFEEDRESEEENQILTFNQTKLFIDEVFKLTLNEIKQAVDNEQCSQQIEEKLRNVNNSYVTYIKKLENQVQGLEEKNKSLLKNVQYANNCLKQKTQEFTKIQNDYQNLLSKNEKESKQFSEIKSFERMSNALIDKVQNENKHLKYLILIANEKYEEILKQQCSTQQKLQTSNNHIQNLHNELQNINYVIQQIIDAPDQQFADNNTSKQLKQIVQKTLLLIRKQENIMFSKSVSLSPIGREQSQSQTQHHNNIGVGSLTARYSPKLQDIKQQFQQQTQQFQLTNCNSHILSLSPCQQSEYAITKSCIQPDSKSVLNDCEGKLNKSTSNIEKKYMLTNKSDNSNIRTARSISAKQKSHEDQNQILSQNQQKQGGEHQGRSKQSFKENTFTPRWTNSRIQKKQKNNETGNGSDSNDEQYTLIIL